MSTRTNMQFPRYHSSTLTIGGYMQKIRDGHWKLATMQRSDSTWPQTHYRELIESIFNNILTSPFIGSQISPLNVSILDGGHRTEAIRRFYDDEIKITCPQSRKELLYSELTEETRAIFNDKPCITIVYEGLDSLQEETLFFRVNNSLPLHPGEAVNGFITVPLCVMAKNLGEHYADDMRSGFKQSISIRNERGESSNVMLMILYNFHRGHIEVGERPTKVNKIKDLCERLRSEVINEEKIKNNVSAMFRIIQKRKKHTPYEFHLIATIQAIMMKYDIGSRTESWSSGVSADERIDKFASLISDFFYEVENPDLAPIQNAAYQSLMRTPHDQTIRGVTNPGTPSNCVKRALIFSEWLEHKKVDLSGLLIR